MKRTLLALPLALVAATSALAADPIEKQIQVVATVPTAAFYVEPVGGGWINDPQELPWVGGQFDTINKQLNIKSTVGPVSAYLISPPVISSGINTIDLDVKVADTSLTTTAAEVLTGPQAAPGRVVGLSIAAKAPTTGTFVPGNYQGLLSMVFETAAP